MANDNHTLHHVSCSLSKIPYGGFSLSTASRPVCQTAPSCTMQQHAQFASVLRALRGGTVISALSRSNPLGEAPPFQRPSSLYPRGPRSGTGYVVPHHPHLIGLIRPTCRHIETSPHGGLYPMPSLCHIGLGPPVVPCFRCAFLLGMPSSTTPQSSSVILTQFFTDNMGLRHVAIGSALSTLPTIRFRWRQRCRGFTGSHSLRPVELLASLADRTRSPQPQRRLHPGFQRVGHPLRCRI